ncbi:MAG: phosphotriesterase [Bacteroidia bacterium]|nr:phosphotriesterase [Bacteroidia bacterium]
MTKKPVLLSFFLILFLSQCKTEKEGIIMTVNGPIPASQMGVSLIHEHILVDFIGADKITEQRWDKGKVIERAMPFLKQIKDLGCQTLVECTPEYLGRDPLLLKLLSYSSGLNILTNTGYYGAVNNKYLPQHAFTESADQLAYRWTMEWVDGIEETLAKPGFIKIGVDNGNLSDLHKKLVIAAARTHLNTGLTIASHTGPAIPAFEQIAILQNEGVAPEAFIWVHAQAEKDLSNHIKAARMGAWIGLDGLNENNLEEYVRMIKNMKENHLLNKVLLSHDAGWYHPGEENGGEYRGYTTLFEKLIPLLRNENFTKRDIHQLMVSNPAKAFTIGVHRIN